MEDREERVRKVGREDEVREEGVDEASFSFLSVLPSLAPLERVFR